MDLAEVNEFNSAYAAVYRVKVDGRIVESEISVVEQTNQFALSKSAASAMSFFDIALAEDWLHALQQVAQERAPKLFSTVPPRPRVLAAIVPTAQHDIVEVRTQRSRVCSTQCINEYARIVGWTRRETEVADLLCAGLVPKQIAGRFSTEVSTVRSQIKSLLIKSGASSIGNLVLTLGRLPAIEITQKTSTSPRVPDPAIRPSPALAPRVNLPAATSPFAPLYGK